MEAPERVGCSSRDLYGDVESLTNTTYKLKDSSEGIIRDEVLVNISFEFNAAGDVTQRKETDKLNSHDYTYKYDLNGKLLEEAGYNSDGSLFSKKTYVYDSKGNVTEESSMVNVYKPMIVKYTFTYEPSGNKIATEYIDGVFTGKYAYKYDSSGNEIEKVSYNYNNVLSSTVVNNYDSNGNKIESMWRKSDGTIYKKEVCEYDSDGNMIEETQYNSDGSLSSKTTYAYDSNGNKTEYCYYLAEVLGTDYGGRGILIIAMLALTRGVPKEKLWRTLGFVVCLWFGPDVFIGSLEIPMELFGLVALIPMYLYDGTKLTRNKWLQWGFYLFYPVHLLILWMLKVYFIG